MEGLLKRLQEREIKEMMLTMQDNSEDSNSNGKENRDKIAGEIRGASAPLVEHN